MGTLPVPAVTELTLMVFFAIVYLALIQVAMLLVEVVNKDITAELFATLFRLLTNQSQKLIPTPFTPSFFLTTNGDLLPFLL